MEKRVIEVSWGTLWRIFIFLIFAVILLFSRDILLGLFMALVVSSGLDALVDFLERRGVPRSLGVILIFLLAAFVIAIAIYFIIPFLIADIKNLFANNGEVFQSFLDRLGNSGAAESFSAAIAKFSSDIFSGGYSSVAFLSKLLGGVGLAAAVLMSSFYLTLSNDGVERFIRAVFPDEAGAKALRIYTRSRRKIGFWFQSQIFLSFIMGFLVWMALLVLGVKHAFVIGVLAGIFEIVPFVGPIFSGAVGVLVALTTSATLGFYVLVAFVVLQQIESHFLVPLLMRKTIDMHPVVVIGALLIGIELGGLLGALVAVPLAAVVQEVLAERG
jgi:predicted PurR-regulated permease PerM